MPDAPPAAVTATPIRAPSHPAVADPRRAAIWMIGALLSFSMVAITGREAMRSVGALELLFWRAGTGLLVLALLHVAMRGTLASLRTGQPALTGGRALVHFAAQLSWMLAVSMIPLVEVFALEFTSPLWVAVLAPLFLRERLTAWRAFAAVVGFGGALVVVWPAGAGPSPRAFVEQLSQVDVAGVEPMTSVTPMTMKKRQDVVTDGGYADVIVGNAPATEDHFFLVPKVVE